MRRASLRISNVRGSLTPLVLLACVLLWACEHAFEPFVENREAGFSVFGFLDLHADTQWIRVSPVRVSTFLGPDPIDAVVTLEHVASGRVITMKDSLVAFTERSFGDELGAVGHTRNFWTAEKLIPLAEYRLEVARSDGLKTTALVTLPEALEFTFQNDVRNADGLSAFATIRADRVLFVDVLHYDVSGVLRLRDPQPGRESGLRTHSYGLEAYPIPGVLAVRHGFEITSGPPTWPYTPETSDLAASIQGRTSSNVVNGYGFVGGVAIRTVPFHRCQVLVAKPNFARNCEYAFNAASAAIVGRIVKDRQCGFPWDPEPIRLIERFPDGSAAVRHQVTGPRGEYRFEAIQPGLAPVLEVHPWSGERVPPVPLPRLAEAQRLSIPDIVLGPGC